MISGRLEINEVSPTTAWGYFLERNVQVMEKGKGIRQNPANSLSWGDGDEGLEDKMARIRRTEHRRGKSCPERKFQWSAEADYSSEHCSAHAWKETTPGQGKNQSRGLEGKVPRTWIEPRTVPVSLPHRLPQSNWKSSWFTGRQVEHSEGFRLSNETKYSCGLT